MQHAAFANEAAQDAGYISDSLRGEPWRTVVTHNGPAVWRVHRHGRYAGRIRYHAADGCYEAWAETGHKLPGGFRCLADAASAVVDFYQAQIGFHQGFHQSRSHGGD